MSRDALTPTGDLTEAEVFDMRRSVLDVLGYYSGEGRTAKQAAHALLQSLALWEEVRSQTYRTGTAKACRALYGTLRAYEAQTDLDKQNRKHYASHLEEGS